MSGSLSKGMSGDEVRSMRFDKPAIGKRGYRPDEVDTFLTRVAAFFDGTGAPVDAAEVSNVVFTGPKFGKRGYEQRQVDDALDRLEQECARRASSG